MTEVVEKTKLELVLEKLQTLPYSQQQMLIKKFPKDEQEAIAEILDELNTRKLREKAADDFMVFVQEMWPNFIHGRHHAKMAQAFERVARGECKRLIINMPPRHTKSEFASYLLPAWFFGKFPGKKVIQTSHTAELAVGFGRKVRNLVDSPNYKRIFPALDLQSDSKAAGRWNTNFGGEYFAIGIGGAVTGKGADILIIDDPHSEQEAAMAQTNPEIYDKTYEWYTSGPRQRLQPGGSIVVVMCMTGDTNVLMVDGTDRQLKNIRAGDMVATFDKGRLGSSKINNWQSSGIDSIYKIQTQSDRILRANERHPFLVMNEGVLEWTRLNQLRVGDLLVSLKDVKGNLKQKQSPVNVERVNQRKVTTERTQKLHTIQLGIMESGRMKNADVENQLRPKGCVTHVTQKNSRQQNQLQNKAELGELSTGMGSLPKILYGWLTNVVTGVMSVGSRQPATISAPIGMENCASTTATKLEKSEDCFATTATSQLDTERQQAFLNELHRISDFTIDPIVAITYDGKEEVFDVEVDKTENFIVNGIVSHNTRWSKRDLTGQVIKAAAQRSGEEWEVIEFPAILPSGKPLWPEFWSLGELQALKEELPNAKWQAQYMQQPTSDVSAIIKREWWRIWEQDSPPPCEFIIQSWDTAFLKTERADYSACTTWGVFYQDDDGGVPRANIILLNAFKKRMEFPELKARAYQEFKEWDVDSLIVEAKAAGSPLIFELRAMGIPVQEFTPSKGNDKIARLNAVADMFASGHVWVPNTHWAEELVEEVASFPSGEHDDMVDSMSQALLRYRRGGFIQLASDEEDEPRAFRRKEPYY